MSMGMAWLGVSPAGMVGAGSDIVDGEMWCWPGEVT